MGAHQPVDPIPEDRLFELLRRAASERSARAWIVGGYVRDKLLGRAHSNPDVVVEGGDSLEVARTFAELAGAPPPVVFERFGTAQVTLPGRLVEFVTARVESYAADSRKPEVRPATLDEDLRRRDFTINTLLMDLEGHVEDRLGGRRDLDARLLRTPADPLTTFADDPLRMLRAVRFAAELGFSLAPGLLPAMRDMRLRLAPPVISVERVSDELRRILVSDRPMLGLELLAEATLLEIVLPELAATRGIEQGGYHTHDVYGHTLRVVEGTPPDLVTRLAALFHDVGKPATAAGDGTFVRHEVVGAEMARAALERLRFPNRDVEAVAEIVSLHMRPVFYRSDWTDGAVRRLAKDAGPLLDRLMDVARGDITSSAYPHPEKLDELHGRLEAVRREQPSRLAPVITGDEIMRLRGLSPGPEVGRIKRRLEEMVIDGELEPDRAAVIDYLASHSDV